jgi:hypothetical protein
MSHDLDPAAVLALVTDGKLTLLDRPAWLAGRHLDDLHAANAGCSNAAQRLAALLASDWTWRIGYDNLAELVWRQDASVVVRVISLTPAHALLIGALQALVMGPQGVMAASSGAIHGDDVETDDADRKIGD